MPTNDFKAIADAVGANVLTQSQYLALSSFINNGFSSGIVPSAQMNKALRQTSVMAYVLAQYILTQSGQDVLDNGVPATILTNLQAAIQASAAATTFVTQPFGDSTEKAATDLFVQRAVSAVGGYYQDTGSITNSYVVTTNPPWTAATYPDGFSLRFRTTRANTGAVILNAGTPGGKAITQEDGGALEAGDIPTGSISTVTFSTAANAWRYNGSVPSDFLTSPALRGVPTTPTAAPLTNNTQIASTAYVDAAAAAVVVNAVPQLVNSNIAAGSTAVYWVDTRAAALTITLPNSPVGANILTFDDITASWLMNNLTINPGANTIAGVGGSLICDVAGESFGLWWDATTSVWRIK